MKFSSLSTSSFSYARISISGISPLEKIFARETYWHSLDFRFSLSPSPVINSTFPLQLSTTSKNLLMSVIFCTFFLYSFHRNSLLRSTFLISLCYTHTICGLQQNYKWFYSFLHFDEKLSKFVLLILLQLLQSPAVHPLVIVQLPHKILPEMCR